MDALTTAAGTTSIILIIGISLIPFIIFCVIAYRLKLIINTTFISSREPGVNHYADAKAYEAIGDEKQARRCYYLAYWALNGLGYKKFKWNGELVKVKDIEIKLGILEDQ